jgi:type III secretory pathway component EscV
MVNSIIILIIILVIVALAMLLIERQLRKRLEKKQKNRNLFFIKKTESLEKSNKNPVQKLESLNSLARDFFKERFNLKYQLDYSELKQEFEKSKNKLSSEFCEKMTKIDYTKSEKKLKKQQIKNLISDFKKIIQKYPINN